VAEVEAVLLVQQLIRANSWIVLFKIFDNSSVMVTSPRPGYPLLFLAALLVSTLPLAAQDAFPPTTMARQDAAAYLKPLNKRDVVKLKTIAGDFASNQAAAIGKYSGHRITVIGNVSHLSKGHGDNKVLVVTLQDANASLPAVKGEFLFGSIPDNSEIQISSDGSLATLIQRDGSGNILSQNPYVSVDQTVAIKGDYKEVKVGDIILTGCKLIPKERLHELRNELKASQG
jgi:hypothetical protein